MTPTTPRPVRTWPDVAPNHDTSYIFQHWIPKAECLHSRWLPSLPGPNNPSLRCSALESTKIDDVGIVSLCLIPLLGSKFVAGENIFQNILKYSFALGLTGIQTCCCCPFASQKNVVALSNFVFKNPLQHLFCSGNSRPMKGDTDIEEMCDAIGRHVCSEHSPLPQGPTCFSSLH